MQKNNSIDSRIKHSPGFIREFLSLPPLSVHAMIHVLKGVVELSRYDMKHSTLNCALSKKPFGGISASTLRILALLFMLLDHLWATVVPGNFWMTCIGRLAFPIFAFQLAEGFVHTSNRKQYAYRLLICALISEIPFDLIQAGAIFYPFHQNVIFTLLLGFIALCGMERISQKDVKSIVLGILIVAVALFLAVIGFVDYGTTGVITVMLFYLSRTLPIPWLWQLIGLILLNVVWFEGQMFLIPVQGLILEIPVQGFAVFALLPIWLYNDQKKRYSSRALQYACYLFYPLHLLILYLIVLYVL